MNLVCVKVDDDFVSLTIADSIPDFKISFGGKEMSIKTKKPLQLKEWHHIKVKKDSNVVSMNVNGGRTIEVK